MIFLVHNSHRNFNNLPYQINSILLGTVHEYKRLTQLTDHQRWKPKGQGVLMFLQRLSVWQIFLVSLQNVLFVNHDNFIQITWLIYECIIILTHLNAVYIIMLITSDIIVIPEWTYSHYMTLLYFFVRVTLLNTK